MHKLLPLRSRSTTAGLGVIFLALALLFTSGGGAQASLRTAATSAPRAIVSHTPAGSLGSSISGHTANGRTVTGKFIPMHFYHRNGHEKVRGVVKGVVHNFNGTTRTFWVIRSFRVASINGQSPIAARTSTATARATCSVLHLTLGPLDLNLLGLMVHLDRVVLNIDAQSGPGNLLGNLLCAVAGLLDGGPLAGLLGQLSNLLNQILGQLGLGL